MPITHIDVLTIQPLVALLFGILILVIPRLLNYLIAIYLIMIGAMGLWPQLLRMPSTNARRRGPPSRWIRSGAAVGRPVSPRPARNRDRAARRSAHCSPAAR